MLFQDVVRHTIYLLAEAERNVALNERLRGEMRNSENAGKTTGSGHRLIVRNHAAAVGKSPSRDGEVNKRE
jgi:hypothetical protein